MVDDSWEMVDKISGSMQADMISGLLKAQGIEVVLMQEGVGTNVFPVNFGPLSEVEVYVPSKDLETARQILNNYYSGKFEIQASDEEAPGDSPSGESNQG